MSDCQKRRVIWGALLWQDQAVDLFLTSGNAVYSPYVEAELMAAGLEALGVPADRIFLEPQALHTDENIHNSLLVANAQGWELVVATDGIQARGGCAIARAFDTACTVMPIATKRYGAILPEWEPVLDAVRVPMDPEFVPVEERHAAREADGAPHRPPSLWLYAGDIFRQFGGKLRVPYTPSGAGTLIPWQAPLAQGDLPPPSSGG